MPEQASWEGVVSMSQHPSLDCLLTLLPFQLTGAIVAGEARGQRALVDGRWGRSWTRAKHQSPASALPIQSLMAVDHTLGPKRQESRDPRSIRGMVTQRKNHFRWKRNGLRGEREEEGGQ